MEFVGVEHLNMKPAGLALVLAAAVLAAGCTKVTTQSGAPVAAGEYILGRPVCETARAIDGSSP